VTVGNFDHDTRDQRWATYIHTGEKGPVFEAAWARLRASADIGVEETRAAGALGQAAVAAGLDDRGKVIVKLQKELTKQVEDCEHRRLTTAMAALPRGHSVRLAYEQWDRFGSQFIDALPNKRDLICTRDWREAWSHFLGIPNADYGHLVGRPIVVGRQATFDPHGWELCCAILKGRTWTTIHDNHMHLLCALATDAGYDMPMEPEGIFLSAMAQAARAAFRSRSLGERRGLIPDFVLKRLNPPGLGDVKCQRVTKAVRKCTVPGQAMKRREVQVDYAMRVKLHKYDREYCGWRGARFGGPLCTKLGEFGRVKGFIFGPWGVSADLKWLVNQMATAKAAKSWRLSGARNASDAKRVFAATMRRRIGVTMVREQARLKFDRIEIMLNGNRSHAAAQFHGQQNMQQDQEDYYNRHGPQGFSGGRGDGRRYRGR
jgi:hypothetical protein